MVLKRASGLLLAAMLLMWFAVLRPSVMGGPATYVWVSGISMEPTLHDGDLAVIRVREVYRRHDVVAFRVPRGQPGAGAIVIHRIVRGSAEEGFVTQGDNKDVVDMWRPRTRDIIGGLWFRLPRAAVALRPLRDRETFAAFVAAFSVFLFLLGGGPTERRRASPEGASAANDSRAAEIRSGAWARPVVGERRRRIMATLVAGRGARLRHGAGP
jgi:signal peptidase I